MDRLKERKFRRSVAQASAVGAQAKPVGLPIELWIDILRKAQYDDGIARYKWIKRYALVCRAWRCHAQQLLFRHVALRGSIHCKTFVNGLRSITIGGHADILTSSVETLSIAMDHQDIYADAIGLCSNLQELDVCLYHASFRPTILEKLRPLSGLRVLRVRAHHYTALFQLLARFPDIEYLEVNCSGAQDPFPDLSHPAPSWRLRELRYANFRRGTHGFVEWAVSGRASGTRETLEVLHVQSLSFDPSSVPALGLTRLRSLSVPCVTDGDDLSQLTHLQEIGMTHPRHPPPAFLPLPPGIRHISLHHLEKGDVEDVLAALEEYYDESDKELRVVTYHRSCEDKDDLLEDLRMLHDFFEARDIEFRLMDPPYGYYACERVPFEPVLTFPRPAPLSSRRQADMETLLQRAPPRQTMGRKFVRSMKRALASSSALPPLALAK
ncbi:hypothetical protein LXA43DRAFT_1039804 [Ganoderma leucocontextum]|nr:hypothetical protein LXA43DRAFT_1039804 [Ganoderma leucocontextum]